MSPTCYQNALNREKSDNPPRVPDKVDTIGNHLICGRSEFLDGDEVQECPLLGNRASLLAQGYRSARRFAPRRVFLLVCSIGTPEGITLQEAT
ncbi:MAG: hypothetical protein HOH33_18065 [Verrucomicrobia bacterium]|nr:hypothetical protein [Verrucomicrobiota bacterium]